MEEKPKTLTGVESKEVYDHIETLTRRISYLDERITLRNNSFDRRERKALRHCVWLLTLELENGIVLTDEKTSRETDSRSASVGSNSEKTRIILRRKTENNGID